MSLHKVKKWAAVSRRAAHFNNLVKTWSYYTLIIILMSIYIHNLSLQLDGDAIIIIIRIISASDLKNVSDQGD